MNDLEKAIALINDRKIKLIDISKDTGIPLITIRKYSANHDKLKKASWERVYQLAQYYEKKLESKNE